MTRMKLQTALRNLDRHGQQRAPEVIKEEIRQLEPRLARFKPELVRLEVTVSQTRGKMIIHASLRLQLPSGIVVAQEEGREVEPVLRKAFADLRKRLERHVARLKRESEWKRPARRARIGALLPPARDKAEADRRGLYFDLIEDHLDKVYDAVRRELTYLQANGAVPGGALSVRDLVDATILKGLDHFEKRPTEFSVGDWLIRLAYETIEAEARALRRALPDGVASLDAEPEEPTVEPTQSDAEMFDYYQPDEVLHLEDLVSDDTSADPETEVAQHEAQAALHRAIADLPALWRKVLLCFDLEGKPPENTAVLLDLSQEDVGRIAEASRTFLREKLHESGHADDCIDETIARARRQPLRVPQPQADRERIRAALGVEDRGEAG
jgi:RNA polymerase sigma factor (sigma-70 family)